MDNELEKVHFGEFSLSVPSGKLEKNGRTVRLAPQPTRVLELLVRRAGEIVPRETIEIEIWGPGTVVDFDRSINSCIKQIRAALGDDAGDPRYVQTVPGSGYRFVAAVDGSPEAGSKSGDAAPHRARVAAGIAAAGLLLGGALWWRTAPIDDSRGFEEHGWVLIADFGSDAPAPELQRAASYALTLELSQSAYLRVASPQRIADALRLMKKPEDSIIDAALGREICMRDGGIDALVSGHLAKRGDRVVLSAMVTEPVSGTVIGSARRETAHGDEVVEALGLLARDVRRILGERLPPNHDGDSGPLERATTTSLAALELFSQAMRVVDSVSMGARRWEVANALLREAVATDPEFALAHIYLAHGYANRSENDLAGLHFERALELSHEVSQRERLFIEGSYFGTYADEPTRARTAYETLLSFHPDHFWATNNLMGLAVEARRFDQVVELAVRRAHIRPNDVGIQVNAALQLLRTARDPERAEEHMQKARDVYETNPLPLSGHQVEWIYAFPAIERWLDDDVDAARALLMEAEERLGASKGVATDEALEFLGFLRVGLGELRRAESLFESITTPGRRHNILVLTAIARGDPAEIEGRRRAAERYVAELGPLLPIGLFPHLFLAGGAELPAELALAEEWHRVNASRHFWQTEPYVELARGEALLDEGDAAGAEALLEEGLRRIEHHRTSGNVLGLESLARARLELGDTAGALSALQRAADFRSHSPPSFIFFWQRARWREAALLRELGRAREATPIETELRNLLRYADDDHEILQALRRGAPSNGAGGM